MTPEEEVFYLVALLRSAVENGNESQTTLENLGNQNRDILKFCKDSGIGIKEYLPHYSTQQEWKEHFGEKKWEKFKEMKLQFDPKHILSTGQLIFSPSFNAMTASW